MNHPKAQIISSKYVEEDGKLYKEFVSRIPIDVAELKAQREKRIQEADVLVGEFDKIESETSIKVSNKPKKINK